jgi:DNA-binding GntR family transcriptional regulator
MSPLEGYGNGKASNLTTQVYERIRQDIIEGRYQSGEALTEQGLADYLQVSRTPIREALRQLELEGLMEIRPNKGAIVVGIHSEDVRDIYTIRSLIEGLAAEKAAQHATDEQVDRLQETVDLMEFYLERQSLDKMRAMDDRFHQMIYEISGSRMLNHILKDLHVYAEQFRGQSIKKEGRAHHTLEEHRAVFEAIRDHQPETAREKMTEHIRNSAENMEINHLL